MITRFRSKRRRFRKQSRRFDVNPDDLSYLYSLTNEYRSIRYDLQNMRALAAALGNPQQLSDRF